MRSVVAYALPLNPEPWTVGSPYVIRTGKKLFARIAPDKTLKVYQNAIRDELLLQDAKVLPGLYVLRLTFARQLYSYTRTEDGGKSSRNRADNTNIQKATEDALQGVLIENDRDVVRIESVCIEQSREVDPFILIELMHGLTEDDFTHWESHLLTIEGQRALDNMELEQSLREEKKRAGNVWTP